MAAQKRKTTHTFKGKPVYTANGRYFTIKKNGMWEFVAKKKLGLSTKKKGSPPKKTSGKAKKSKSKYKSKQKGGKHMAKVSTVKWVRRLAVGGSFVVPMAGATKAFMDAGTPFLESAALGGSQMLGYNQSTHAFDGNLFMRRGGIGLVVTGGDIVASKFGAYKHLGKLFGK